MFLHFKNHLLGDGTVIAIQIVAENVDHRYDDLVQDHFMTL